MNTQVYERACEWLVELRAVEPDESTRSAFHAWLKEAPAHLAAYLEVTALWNESAGIPVREKWPMEALIAEARRGDDNVIALSDLPSGSGEKCSAAKSTRTRRRWAFAASIAAVSVALGAGFLWWELQATTYVTAIGEQRSVSLPDGSTVHLNARSKVRVRYSQQMRLIDLRQGQALFDVAQESARPFIVASDAVRVSAIGTKFDVNRTPNGITVTVVEGRVAVSSLPPGQVEGAKAEPASVLSAGEQAVVTAAAVETTRRADPVRVTAWMQRRLVFASTPLSEVVEEFNRYNERQLVVRDQALESFEIDGVFSSTNPAALVRFLRERPGVGVVERGDAILITKEQ